MPVLRYSTSIFKSTAANLIEPADYFSAVFDLLTAFNWAETNLVYDNSLESGAVNSNELICNRYSTPDFSFSAICGLGHDAKFECDGKILG